MQLPMIKATKIKYNIDHSKKTQKHKKPKTNITNNNKERFIKVSAPKLNI
jgi:hypothetical protein